MLINPEGLGLNFGQSSSTAILYHVTKMKVSFVQAGLSHGYIVFTSYILR